MADAAGRKTKALREATVTRTHVFLANCLMLLALWLGFSPAAVAQSYPSRQITLVVPFPAGSATDGVARRLADSVKEATGAVVIVENKPGADGNLAALSVLRAEPDGYTVFVTTQLDACGERQSVQFDAVRSEGGLRRRRGHHDDSDDADGEAGFPGEDGERVHRRGQEPKRSR